MSEQLSLVFSLAAEVRPIYLGAGLDIPAYNGDDTFRLPVPATCIAGSDGIIKADFVNTDYTQRMEPAEIVAVPQLSVGDEGYGVLGLRMGAYGE